MTLLNVELKARDPDRERSLRICRELGAEDRGELWQRDTYFRVSTGALKLREQRPGQPHPVQYERERMPQERQSRYVIAAVADAESTREALANALGVLATVTKSRRLFLWSSVRIHLDEVEALGHPGA